MDERWFPGNAGKTLTVVGTLRELCSVIRGAFTKELKWDLDFN